MKKLLLFLILSNAMSTVALADDFDDFTIKTAWGWSGFEIGADSSTLNTDDKNYFKERYLELESELDRTYNFLQRDDRDKDKLFNVHYNNISSKSFTGKSGEIILGLSNSSDERFGIKGIFGKNKLKESDDKIDKLGGQLFYNFNDDVTNYFIAGFYNYHKLNDEKIEDMGIDLRYKKLIENLYFEYINPSYFLGGNYTLLKDKIKDKSNKSNRSLAINAGLEAKNEVEINDIKITTKLYTGLEHEFFDNKKYKSLNINEKDKDNAILGISFSVKATEVVNVFLDAKVKKSLNTDNQEEITSLGVKIAL